MTGGSIGENNELSDLGLKGGVLASRKESSGNGAVGARGVSALACSSEMSSLAVAREHISLSFASVSVCSVHETRFVSELFFSICSS